MISSKRGLDIEEIDDQIVNELYWRSFIQDVEKVKFDDVNYFKMYDLVYDLAHSIKFDDINYFKMHDLVYDHLKVM